MNRTLSHQGNFLDPLRQDLEAKKRRRLAAEHVIKELDEEEEGAFQSEKHHQQHSHDVRELASMLDFYKRLLYIVSVR